MKNTDIVKEMRCKGFVCAPGMYVLRCFGMRPPD